MDDDDRIDLSKMDPIFPDSSPPHLRARIKELESKLSSEREEWEKAAAEFEVEIENQFDRIKELEGRLDAERKEWEVAASEFEVEIENQFDRIKGLEGRLDKALELLKKCVTTGYSRHEINCFLADSATGVETQSTIGQSARCDWGSGTGAQCKYALGHHGPHDFI